MIQQFLNTNKYLFFLLFCCITITAIVSSCKNADKIDKIDIESCSSEVLNNGTVARIGIEHLISDSGLDYIYDGSWSDYDFLQFSGDMPFNSPDFELISNNYSFNGNKFNFDAKYKLIVRHGDTIVNSAVGEILFSDDFMWIESFAGNWEYSRSIGDSYAHTHIELRDIPFRGCNSDPLSLNYYISRSYKFGIFNVNITQDNIKAFTSSGKYYLEYPGTVEWDISGMNISRKHPISISISIFEIK